MLERILGGRRVLKSLASVGLAGVLAFSSFGLGGCERRGPVQPVATQTDSKVQPNPEIKQIENKFYPNELAPIYGAIRNKQEWDKIWNKEELLLLPSIDFKDQMIVMYNLKRQGKPKEGKVAVSIEDVVETEDALRVRVRENIPSAWLEGGVTQAYDKRTVKKSDKPVIFEVNGKEMARVIENDYFPLHVGDKWVYKGTHGGKDVIQTRVIIDTKVIDDQTYYLFKSTYSPSNPQEPNPIQMFRREGNKIFESKRTFLDLAAEVNPSYRGINLVLERKNVSVTTPLGTFNKCLDFVYGKGIIDANGGLILAPNMGIISYGSVFIGGLFESLQLQSATINGHKHAPK